MRIARRVIGVLLTVAGIVWFLQGISIIPGSFMTGQTRWAVYGALTAAIGLFLMLGGARR